MLSRKSNQMMHNVIKEIKPSKATVLSRKSNQTIMLSGTSCQTIHVIIQTKPNDAHCYQRKSNQTMHNVVREIIPNSA